MKITVLCLFLAVIVFGQPAAVLATFSVQPQQAEDIYSQGFQQAIDEPMQLQKNTAIAQEQVKAEADAIAAVKALAAAEAAVEANASEEDSSSGDKTLMFIIGGLLTSIGVGAKFLIG